MTKSSGQNIAPSKMLIPLILTALLHAAIVLSQNEFGDIELGCPLASYHHGNYCYSLSTIIDLNFHSARLVCASHGGIVAEIRDEETFQFIQRFSIWKYTKVYWIGLTDNKKEGNWVFSDGTSLEKFDRWSPGEPNNHGNNEHCAQVSTFRYLHWNDDSCDKKYFFVCQFYEHQCPKGNNVFRKKKFCFLLSAELATYEQADSACRAKGGILALDKAESTHEALAEAIYKDRSWQNVSDEIVSSLSKNVDQVSWMRSWVGVTRSSRSWKYLDGSLVPNETDFWGPGEPKKEHCVSSGRHWYSNSCKEKRSFICQYAVGSSKELWRSDRFFSPNSHHSVASHVTGTANREVLNNPFVAEKGKISPTEATSGSKGQVVFVILLFFSFILGVVCTAVILKRQVLIRKIQIWWKKTEKEDNTPIVYRNLENDNGA